MSSEYSKKTFGYINPELLISLVRDKPVLWKKPFLPGIKSNANIAWMEICHELNPEFSTYPETKKLEYRRYVMKRWRNIKDQFIKTTKKSQDNKHRKYLFHDLLGFLSAQESSEERGVSSSEEAGYNDSYDAFEEDLSQLAEVTVKQENFSFVDHLAQIDEHDEQSNCTLSFEPNSTVDNATTNTVPTTDPVYKECRHMCFFKSILPSLSEFNDDETLQFQADVIRAIQSIKKTWKEPRT